MATKSKAAKVTTPNGVPEPPREQDAKSCFVIARINEHTSAERRQTDGLLKAVIEPALRPLGITVTAAHILDQSGSISRQIIERLLRDDLVIADLTGHNPNVMYELGVRHAARKPVVILREDGTRIPFDIQSDRVVDYRNDFLGTVELQREVRSKAQAALNDDEPDNPVYAAAQQAVLRDIVGREGNDIQQALMDKILSIESSLAQSGIVKQVPKGSYIHVHADSSRLDRLQTLLLALGCNEDPIIYEHKDGTVEIVASWDASEDSLRAQRANELISRLEGVSGCTVDQYPF